MPLSDREKRAFVIGMRAGLGIVELGAPIRGELNLEVLCKAEGIVAGDKHELAAEITDWFEGVFALCGLTEIKP